MPDSNIGGLNPITALEIDRVNDRLVAWDASATGADRTKRLAILEHGVLVASPNHQTFSNANATISAVTTYLAQVGTMSAARSVTLPLANSVPIGFTIRIADESGTATATNKITLARSGSDTINGVTSIDAIARPYGFCYIVSDGTSKWFLARPQIYSDRLAEIIEGFAAASNGQYLRKNAAGTGIDYGTPSGGVGSSATVTTTRSTLSANLSLTNTSTNYQHLNPNGANRDVTLPASPTGSDPNYFVIRNTATAGTAFGLVVKNSGGTTLYTVPAGFYTSVVWDGTTWEVY